MRSSASISTVVSSSRTTDSSPTISSSLTGDDLFEQLLEGDYAGRAAIFVKDDGHLVVAGPHLGKEVGHVGGFRHKEGRADQLVDPAVEPHRVFGQGEQDVFDGDDADDVVQVVVIDRKAGVAGFGKYRQHLLEGCFLFDAYDARTGDHHLATWRSPNSKTFCSISFLAGLDGAPLLALAHQDLELCHRMDLLVAPHGVQPQQLEQAVARSVQQPDERAEEVLDQHDRPGDEQAGPLGVLEGDRFGASSPRTTCKKVMMAKATPAATECTNASSQGAGRASSNGVSSQAKAGSPIQPRPRLARVMPSWVAAMNRSDH